MTDTNQPHTPPQDDPGLTAYALGELDPSSDVYKHIHARLETDAEAAAFVEQARRLAQQLTDSYHHTDADAGLSTLQQKAIRDMIDQPNHNRPHSTHADSRQVFRLPRKLLLAAGLALAATAAITTVSLMTGPDDTTTTQHDTKPVTGLAQVNAKLAQPVAVDFKDARLGDVLGFVYKQTGVKIDTDWPALATRGVSADTPITLSATDPQPAGLVLSAALQAAWAGSPHPDPAQWSATDQGVSVAPKSALVQQRLDATARLLAGRRFSVMPVDQKLLSSKKAEVWDTSLWNDIRDKRQAAGQAVLTEAQASLDAAEQAANKDDYSAASDYGVYTYRLLAINAALMQPTQFDAPMRRLGELRQAVSAGQLKLDKAAVVKAAEDARANDTALSEYSAAMLAAVEALDGEAYDAALAAVLQAGEALTKDPKQYSEGDYALWATRTVRLQNAIAGAIHRAEADRLALLQEKLAAGTLTDDEKDQALQQHLRSARQLQLAGDYDRAIAEVESAKAYAPDSPVLKGMNELLKDSKIALQSGTLLKRTRELSVATASLRNLEATTRYEDFLAYPGDWPELTSYAYRGLQGGQGGSGTAWRGDAGGGAWTGSVVWNDNHVGFESTDGIQGKYELADMASGSGTRGVPLHAGKKRLSESDFKERTYVQNFFSYSTNGIADEDLGLANLPISGVSNMPQLTNSNASLFGDNSIILSGEVSERLQHQQQKAQQQQGGLLALAPQRSDTRKARLQKQLEELKADAEPGVDQLQRVERERELVQAIERVAVNEPLERARIDAIAELEAMEQAFIEASMLALTPDPQMSRDAYAVVNDNPFYNTAEQGRAMSTFSVDVDTAAYSIVRRQLMQQNQLPVPAAVRIEEMINYFDYGYEAPVVDGNALQEGVVTQASLEAFEKNNEGFAPFTTDVKVTDCPWQAGHHLVRIGIKGMDVAQDQRPPCHLTFLIDVSGSMSSANKLPLVKHSLKMLLNNLNDQDRVSIVVYAGQTRSVIENVPATDKARIEDALNNLKSGGSTAGAAGIQLAYDAASKHFIDGGVNRVILCTDGDFNVGVSDTNELVSLIKNKANPQPDDDGKRRGVYLSVMGFGFGNLNDAMMEPLTNAGNGTYAYIDTADEATKVMYDQAGSMLVAIAKDVKVQVHFDPTQIMAYRLIGYENRVLANEDFADDKVDAGDIGAGHSVTAIYEVVPFDPEDLWDNEEGIYEVRHQIDELDQAIALNQSVMATCSLNEEQSIKLAASTRMLTQEKMLAQAVVNKFSAKAGDEKPDADAGDEEPRIGEAAVKDEEPARPAPELDRFDDGAMIAVKLRYKPVDAPAQDGTSRLIQQRVFANQAVPFELSDEATRFAASVAAYGMLLRHSPHAGTADLNWVIDTAQAASSHDPGQLKTQFRDLVAKTIQLTPKQEPPAAQR